jgi:alkylhydroperoxidase family enzyme
VGRQNGISQEKIADLHDYRSSSLFSQRERLILVYADAMTQTPAEIPETLLAELQAQFDEAQLVELTAAIAWENYRSRFNHAFGLEAEGFSEGAFCAMPVEASTNR